MSRQPPNLDFWDFWGFFSFFVFVIDGFTATNVSYRDAMYFDTYVLCPCVRVCGVQYLRYLIQYRLHGTSIQSLAGLPIFAARGMDQCGLALHIAFYRRWKNKEGRTKNKWNSPKFPKILFTTIKYASTFDRWRYNNGKVIQHGGFLSHTIRYASFSYAAMPLCPYSYWRCHLACFYQWTSTRLN